MLRVKGSILENTAVSHVKAIMDNKKKAPFKKAQEVTVYNMIALKMKAVQRHNKDAVLTAAIAQSIS